MKIKISYTDSEASNAARIENALRRFFGSHQQVKVRKPEQDSPFRHLYMTIGKPEKN
ncbi:MAG: hypothetical protein ACI4JB_01845 [Porcipelethomonas sp.]